jgi:hypothetical protein
MRLAASLLIALAVLAAGALAPGSGDAHAADRKCQTVLTCNFTKGGSYRGCLSSYTCRQCRFVASRCTVGGATGSCRKIVCTWGG